MVKIKNYIIYQIVFSFIFCQRCKENQNFCKRCDISNTICEKCESYVFSPDENGGCIGSKRCYIGKNHCDECNDENNLCAKCEVSFYPDENGGCSYVNNCELSYNGKCLKCKTDYILIGEEKGFKICKSLYTSDLKNCHSIDKTTGFCEICEEGYYLNKGDKKCIKTENCYESSYGICSICNSGYYLDKKEDKCFLQENQFIHCKETLNGITCDECENNYYFDSKGNCISANFCDKSENNKCITCKSNYYLTGNGETCSLDKNCFSADKETGICKWCNLNYYLKYSEKKCILNDENSEYINCKIVDEEREECLECVSGYSLGEDKKCSLTKNCKEIKKGICKKCSDGYYLGLDNKCTNYEHCIYSNFHYECNECEDGYVWNVFNHTCEEWGIKLKGCKILDIGGDICSSCKNNYYLNETDNLCYNNMEQNKYYKCTRVSGNNCMKCLSNYYLGKEDYKCSRIFNCQKSNNENICEKCNENYCLDLNKMSCEYNREISDENDKKYFRCVRTNEESSKCEECQKGLILTEDGICINEEDCLEKEGDVCVYCESKNNPFKSYCLNKIYGCVETKDENCYRCDDIYDFNICTECYDEFEKSDEGKCISKSF
jgi:hypothetical protein